MKRIKKYKKLIFILLVFTALIPPIFKTNKLERIYQSKQICYNSECFQYEIADSPEARQLGLMYRKSLSINSGMLFIFQSSSNYKFWMKNTLIPLDIVWLDKDLMIQYISHDTQPCKQVDCPSYGGDFQSSYVLEVNSGLSEERKVGKKMILK